VDVVGALVLKLLGGANGIIEGLMLVAAVVGASLSRTTGEGGSLGEDNGTLEGGATLEVGAPVETMVGTATMVGTLELEGAELGAATGIAVRNTGLSIGASGSISCRNRRCLVRGSGACFSLLLVVSVLLAVVLPDNRGFFRCALSAWQPATRQATKITNALGNMVNE
jgi:hypothetical protein